MPSSWHVMQLWQPKHDLHEPQAKQLPLPGSPFMGVRSHAQLFGSGYVLQFFSGSWVGNSSPGRCCSCLVPMVVVAIAAAIILTIEIILILATLFEC